MIDVLLMSVAATVLVSLVSFVGLLGIGVKTKILDKVIFLLIGLSAGALIGGALIHLMPEALEAIGGDVVPVFVIVGFSLFFLIERGLFWHHCHKHGKCEVHTFRYMNLIGDGVHNFIDGLLIAASFSAGAKVGVATTLAVVVHEIPQEIGDFGVLVYGGFSKRKALIVNFLSALTAVLGAVVGSVLVSFTEKSTPVLLAFTAGGFLYIGASDLIPELHKEPNLKKSMMAFAFFLIGIVIMFIMKMVLA